MYNFEFVKPATLDEALAALKDEDAQPLSGGQTLIPTMKQRLAAPTALVDSCTATPSRCSVPSGAKQWTPSPAEDQMFPFVSKRKPSNRPVSQVTKFSPWPTDRPSAASG